MRAIIADDQMEVRSALRLLLEEKLGMKVIGEAGTAAELVDRARMDCPDLLLLDWELAGMKPGDTLPLHLSLNPLLFVIVFSSLPQNRALALACGAKEFICKSDPPDRLLKALDKCKSR